MSFENLFRIRPVGVVSKKDIGDRRMFLSIPVWRVRDAITPADASVSEEKSTMNAWENPRPA